jgi:hypothetical protein
MTKAHYVVEMERSPLHSRRLPTILLGCLLANAAFAKGLSKRDLDGIRAAQHIDVARPVSTHVSFDTAQSKINVAMSAALPGTTWYRDSSELEEKFFEHFKISDPLLVFETHFAEALKGPESGQPRIQTRILNGKREIAAAIKATTAEYVVEIDQPSLSISEHVMRRPRFEIMLMGWAKIRRVRDKATVWSGLCTFYERDDKRLIFDEDPLVDDAAILRKLIPVAAEGCATKLMARLKLTGESDH